MVFCHSLCSDIRIGATDYWELIPAARQTNFSSSHRENLRKGGHFGKLFHSFTLVLYGCGGGGLGKKLSAEGLGERGMCGSEIFPSHVEHTNWAFKMGEEGGGNSSLLFWGVGGWVYQSQSLLGSYAHKYSTCYHIVYILYLIFIILFFLIYLKNDIHQYVVATLLLFVISGCVSGYSAV